jgi:hypothetical protein
MPRNVTSLSMRNINEKCMINIINYKHKKRLIIIIILIVAPASMLTLSGIYLLLAVTMNPFLGLITLGRSLGFTYPIQSSSDFVPSRTLHPV